MKKFDSIKIFNVYISLIFHKIWQTAELQLFPSCHIDVQSQLLLIFLSSAPLKTYSKKALSTNNTLDHHQLFSAVSKLPYGWSITILIGIFELSTPKNLLKENRPKMAKWLKFYEKKISLEHSCLKIVWPVYSIHNHYYKCINFASKGSLSFNINFSNK